MSDVFLRDIINIPDSVHAGSFKVELSGGFAHTDDRVAEYVVTEQLQQAFREALSVVRKALRDGDPHAAYLHGSFGSGKSHFLTVLHAILNGQPSARSKPGLQPVIAEHDEWLRGKKFLMVPYHLVGSADIDSALLGGYVSAVQRLHPDAPMPPVYRADAMLEDARRQREFLANDTKFADWLGIDARATVHDSDDLAPIGGAVVSVWSTAELDRAFQAHAGDPVRDQLISALLSGPMSAYIRGAAGDANAFIPLEDGLSVISRHAKDLGYDGLILFLDELILWLQAHMTDQKFINNQVGKLVKLIESGVGDRPLPIVSFISRQRDLSKLVGEDVTGADVKNLESQVEYLAGRFDVVTLEDRNLPAIIAERVLKPVSDQARRQLSDAFSEIESAKGAVKDVLLDANGVTGADWSDFRSVYPLSPALLNVLVTLSGALQRERTGLKLLQEMLYRRRADMKLGELIPLGDLWDVLSDGTGEAFTDKLRRESEAATRFYGRVRTHLLEKYGSADDARFRADDRFIKTLLLSSLAPTVSALARLTGPRLAALNHGSIRSRTVEPGAMAVSRMRELQAEFGELRSDGDEDPVFSLTLSDLDIEPLLDRVGEIDRSGERRIWVKNQLWEALGVKDSGSFVCEREIIWRGTRRVAEFVFENVRDQAMVPDQHFEPSVEGRVRFILDYPFDTNDNHPSSDALRVRELKRGGLKAATVVWLPHFFSPQKAGQLGRLLKIQHLLERDRLDDYASHLSADDRIRVRHQLLVQAENLTSQLTAVLRQLYGISRAEDANVGSRVMDDEHVLTLQPGFQPRLQGGADFEFSMHSLADALFASLYPKNPDLDPAGSRKAVTPAELRIVLNWITRAAENGNREVVDRKDLALVRRVVHPLEIGEVHDGPLNLTAEWRRRIDQQAAANGVRGDYRVEDVRDWISQLGYTGLDKLIGNLLIASFALLSDRAWLHQGAAVSQPPTLDQIGSGWSLRAQALPDAQQFADARARAGTIFGVHVPDTLLARNVQRLADAVRAKVTELEPAVNGVRRSLAKHSDALGIADGADRLVSAHDAADLLARLGDHRDATPSLIELANAGYRTSDAQLASALTQAPALLKALEQVDWALLDSVRALAGRGDSIGDKSDRLLTELSAAASAHEFTKQLAPVLHGIRGRAIALITEAARASATVQSEPGPPPQPGPAAQQPSPPADVDPPTPERREPDADKRGTRRTHRVRADNVESALIDALREIEIQAFAEANPTAEVEIEVSWRLVDDTGQARS